MKNIEKVCSNCKFYEAYYLRDRNMAFYRAGHGRCIGGVVRGNRRAPRPQTDETPACEYYLPASRDECQNLFFEMVLSEEKIVGCCTFFHVKKHWDSGKCKMRNEKRPAPKRRPFWYASENLVGANHFIGTQATGAGIDAAGFTVDDSLYTPDVRLPSTVGASVRVGNFNTESNAFSADITFCHLSAPPSADWIDDPDRPNVVILSDTILKIKRFPKNFLKQGN